MVKIDILDIIEGLYNVENSNIFIENYLKSETMFGEENPVNKRVRAIKNSEVTSPIFQSMEKSFIADDRSYIPQAMERNYTSSDNSSSININMGGITQNITGQNGEDILDILVEKLVKGINTGGESPR